MSLSINVTKISNLRLIFCKNCRYNIKLSNGISMCICAINRTLKFNCDKEGKGRIPCLFLYIDLRIIFGYVGCHEQPMGCE